MVPFSADLSQTPWGGFVHDLLGADDDDASGGVIDTLAYQFTRQPPQLTRPRRNVVVRLCDIECCFSHPLDSRDDVEPRNAAFASDLRRWAEVAAKANDLRLKTTLKFIGNLA